jgi:hypothetical protein
MQNIYQILLTFFRFLHIYAYIFTDFYQNWLKFIENLLQLTIKNYHLPI